MRQAAPEVEAPMSEMAQSAPIAADSIAHRRPQAASIASSTTMIATRAEAASAHFEETAHPTRIESVFSLANALDDIADRPPSEGEADDFMASMAEDMPDAEQPADPAESVVAEIDDDPDSPELSDEPAPALAIDETDPESDETPTETGVKGNTTKVSDLEEEMARLLGEITSKRDS
jgi:hypothetical protein